MAKSTYQFITTFVQFFITWYQRRTRGYAEIDVANYRIKFEEARDRMLPMHLTKHEFRAMQETVNRGGFYMGEDDVK